MILFCIGNNRFTFYAFDFSRITDLTAAFTVKYGFVGYNYAFFTAVYNRNRLAAGGNGNDFSFTYIIVVSDKIGSFCNARFKRARSVPGRAVFS